MYYFLEPTPAGTIYHLTAQRVGVGIKNLPEYDKGDIPSWSTYALLKIISKVKKLVVWTNMEGKDTALFSIKTGEETAEYFDDAYYVVVWLLENNYIKYKYLCNMRKLIIAMVGKSGSGKTTLGRYMAEHLGYNWICSYTTRPMREEEINGVDHRFVDESEMPGKDKMMAYTLFGGYHYWTTFDQFDDELPNIYIVDEKGLIEMESMLINNHKKYDVLKVYVDRENIDVDENRKQRDDDREELPERYYDVVLKNDGDLNSFLQKSTKEIYEIVNLIRN